MGRMGDGSGAVQHNLYLSSLGTFCSFKSAAPTLMLLFIPCVKVELRLEGQIGHQLLLCSGNPAISWRSCGT